MAFGRVLGLDPSAAAAQIAKSIFGAREVAVAAPNLLEGFAAGTRVRTPTGLRRVETLKPGDMVETQDAGAQPVVSVERMRLPALRTQAPIRFAAGAHGADRAVLVAPQQRVLVRDPVLEMLFGEAEVLVAARTLVDGEMVSRHPGGMVDYVRLVFDCAHMVFAEGLAVECFRPGPRPIPGEAQPEAGAPRMLRLQESQMMRKLVI
ncbi:Hint domain-containing protein [Rhodobacter capsulatus]|nr:Hint domain-containing protein [Rhodobacter capsulatus]